MTKNIYLALLIMILTVYSVRAFPFILLRKNITNVFIRSFLYYVPYVTLSVMTFPAIVTATSSIISGLVALAVGLFVARWKGDLFTVACSACAAVFITELIIL